MNCLRSVEIMDLIAAGRDLLKAERETVAAEKVRREQGEQSAKMHMAAAMRDVLTKSLPGFLERAVQPVDKISVCSYGTDCESHFALISIDVAGCAPVWVRVTEKSKGVYERHDDYQIAKPGWNGRGVYWHRSVPNIMVTDDVAIALALAEEQMKASVALTEQFKESS
jgi:hypothetical protein